MSLTNGFIITNKFYDHKTTPFTTLKSEDIFPQYSQSLESLYIPTGKIAIVNLHIYIDHTYYPSTVFDQIGLCQLYLMKDGIATLNTHSTFFSPALIPIEGSLTYTKGQSITEYKKIILNEGEKLRIDWEAGLTTAAFYGYFGFRCSGYITDKTQ